jgi:general secretion pathway protein I
MVELRALLRMRRRGFTLVEILVAFAILALTFGVVMQALSGGLRLLSASGSHAGALRLAETRLAEAGRSFPVLPSAQTGEEGRYRWRLDIAPYDGNGSKLEAPSVPGAYTVTVTVSWGRGRSLTLSTVDLGPPGDG